jgi:chromosome segregation protein
MAESIIWLGEAVRLKHLDLQGYKSFATRTEFVFDGGGITAIVGPNGSGKSNVADAVRWVLGEQSYRTLRGKRTEDMIFSGSSGRARLGMASASLTLDNSDGWLPIDYQEVAITRRAYRSGENEYLLNGGRVRLRDIGELLAASGLGLRSYTVIGQGLVDAVLSLRAEDRRVLFEEAAGISLYQSKRSEALSRLEETRGNLLRVNDIINEISPGLGRLQRDAERTERHALLSEQLEGLLRTWYGYRWRQAQQDLLRVRDALSRREVALARRREAVEELDRQEAAIRARQMKLREQLGAWHGESGKLHQQMEEVQRQLAVWNERSRLLGQQGEELQSDLMGLEMRAAGLAERIAVAEMRASERRFLLEEKKHLVEGLQAELDTCETERARVSKEMAELRAGLLDLATREGDRRSRLELSRERRGPLVAERAKHLAAIAALRQEAGELQAQIDADLQERQALDLRAGGRAQQVAGLEADLASVQDCQVRLQAMLVESQAGVERLQARYELLQRLRSEGEGLRAGVRAVRSRIAPGAGAAPSGMIGVVAEQLRVAVEYEVAIEAVLGVHLQDLIFETWDGAQSAVAYLRAAEQGRATFWALDRLRAFARLDPPREDGVLGLAADFVQVESRLSPLVDCLLGEVLLVSDLETALRLGARFSGRFRMVTLDGEVVDRRGSVTVGRGPEEADERLLAREREWRELPDQRAAAERHYQECGLALEEEQQTEQGIRKQVAALRAANEEDRRQVELVSGRIRDREREREGALQRITWRQDLVQNLEVEAHKLDGVEAALLSELDRLVGEKSAVEQRVEVGSRELERLQVEPLYRRLSEAQADLAVASAAWEQNRGELHNLQEARDDLQRQIEAKKRRIEEITQEKAGLSNRIKERTSRESVIRGWLSSLGEKIGPAEQEIERLDRELARLERERADRAARLRDAESSHGQAALNVSRQEDRVKSLRRQIVDDFGLVEMQPAGGLPEQPPLPLGEMVSALPAVEFLPPGIEEELGDIRGRLRRIGPVNPHAPEQYTELLERHRFLTGQAADLADAADSLRRVVAELDDVMRREFVATFRR